MSILDDDSKTKRSDAGVDDVVVFPDRAEDRIDSLTDRHAAAVGDAISYPAQVDAGAGPLAGRHVAEVDDAVSVRVGLDVDYSEFNLDADGNIFLGSRAILALAAVDTTQGSFGNPVSQNHWGAAKDGKFYANGVECGPGDFGTVVDGFRDSAWAFSGRKPHGRQLFGNPITMPSDGTLTLSGTYTTAGSNGVTSLRRWYLTGDFDIQLDFANFVSSAVGAANGLSVNIDSANSFQIYRYGVTASGVYRIAKTVAGSWSSVAEVATTDTAGKLRLTRVAGVLTAYYWTGVWTLGATASDAVFAGNVQVDISMYGVNATNSVDMSNFVINSGVTDNRAQWAKEAFSTERGTQESMPDKLAVVCADTSVDLIDTDNDKLWMRFIHASNNLLFDTNFVVRDVAWVNGVLYLAGGSYMTEGDLGIGVVADFNVELVRVHRRVASSITGGVYGGSIDRVLGCIATRNQALAYAHDSNTWETPNYRHFGVSAYIDGDVEYRAWATGDGVAVFKADAFWSWVDSGVIDRSKGTETGQIRACHLDPSTGELFYMDSNNLYSVPKATWEGVMATTQVFSAAVTKALAGLHNEDQQYKITKVGTKIYVPAIEGVYMIDWPSGSFVLQYGDADSGAVYPILPETSRVASVTASLDGTTNVLLCALIGEAPVAIVNLDLNTLYGVSEPTSGKNSLILAVY